MLIVFAVLVDLVSIPYQAQTCQILFSVQISVYCFSCNLLELIPFSLLFSGFVGGKKLVRMSYIFSN